MTAFAAAMIGADAIADLQRRLSGVLGRAVRGAALVAYATDATPVRRGRPHLIVLPATTDEVAAVDGVAHEHRVPAPRRRSHLTPR